MIGCKTLVGRYGVTWLLNRWLARVSDSPGSGVMPVENSPVRPALPPVVRAAVGHVGFGDHGRSPRMCASRGLTPGSRPGMKPGWSFIWLR